MTARKDIEVGKVIEIKPGKTVKTKVKLKRSGVNDRELQPLSGLTFFGPDKSDSYVQDILFQYVQRVGLTSFVLGKVKKLSSVQYQLGLIRFENGTFSQWMRSSIRRLSSMMGSC